MVDIGHSSAIYRAYLPCSKHSKVVWNANLWCLKNCCVKSVRRHLN